MIKNKILENPAVQQLFEYLVDFDKERDFNVSVMSTEKVNLKNAIFNVKKINEKIDELGLPLSLKCGMIGKISVKVS